MAANIEPPSGSEVLLLEDDSVLRRRLAAHLRSLGAEVTEVSSVAEARQALSDLQFDFALVDLHLPDGDALELLREGAFSENTGVVVMTAFGGVKEAVEAMRMGAGDYLSKPFEPAATSAAAREGTSSAQASTRPGMATSCTSGRALRASGPRSTWCLRPTGASSGTCPRSLSRGKLERGRACLRPGSIARGPGRSAPSFG